MEQEKNKIKSEMKSIIQHGVNDIVCVYGVDAGSVRGKTMWECCNEYEYMCT